MLAVELLKEGNSEKDSHGENLMASRRPLIKSIKLWVSSTNPNFIVHFQLEFLILKPNSLCRRCSWPYKMHHQVLTVRETRDSQRSVFICFEICYEILYTIFCAILAFCSRLFDMLSEYVSFYITNFILIINGFFL